MNKILARFKCKKCKIWFFRTQNNQGKCTICNPRKPIKPEPSKK